MSRAWYKPGVAPKLLRSFSRDGSSSTSNRSIEVWNSTCVVTAFGKSTDAACNVLINPGNPQLSGVDKFPYFPKGGPAPKEYPKKYTHPLMGYVTQWGGMEVGDGMLYATSVVDGLVHQLGGWRLALEIGLLPVIQGDDEKCPVGNAVLTAPGGADLQQQYDHIVHTVPPFYRHHPDPEYYLMQCYKNALGLAFQTGSRVACPLLGAGGRGFPLDAALEVAGNASMQWCHSEEQSSLTPTATDGRNQCLAFAIPDTEIAEALLEALEDAEAKQSSSVTTRRQNSLMIEET